MNADTPFLERLQTIAAAEPDRIALIGDGKLISYGQAVAVIEHRAALLRQAGLAPGDRVALIAENSPQFLLTAFAIWQANGVLVTIYPSSGAADLTHSITSSDPTLLIVDEHTEQAVRAACAIECPITYVDDNFAPSQLRVQDLATPSDPRGVLRLICYTSGTSSRPKAVMLSEEGLLNGARTYAEVWRLGPTDVTLVCLPMAWLFGLCTTSMATLYTGGRVVVSRRARPEMILDAIVEHRVTFLPAVTTIFTKLVRCLLDSSTRPDLSSLRLCISGGEPRNETAFDQWTELSGRPVHDTFCASESFPLITYDPVADPSPVRGSAGKLVPRSEIKVVDAEGAPVAAGEIGEALVRGPGLMLGYWRDPEQTAAALTPDGYYRQKDLVRIDDEGYVFVVGRLSDMIIRGGSNVSPAEVERVLREHQSVEDVAVVGLPDPMYGQRITAAVVIARGMQLDAKALSEFAAHELSGYKIPTEYILVDALPQNSTTGKVDRRRLATELDNTGAHA